MIYRQGDVLLIKKPVKTKVTGEKVKPENGRLILARGEATGHHHSVSSSCATMTRDGEGLWLVVDKPTTLDHQEHAAIEIQPGIYWVVRQREYSPKEIRRVQD